MSSIMDPNQVQVSYVLNITQVELVLEGLAKLELGRVEVLRNNIRDHAVNTLREAEAALKAALANQNQQQPAPERAKAIPAVEVAQALSTSTDIG